MPNSIDCPLPSKHSNGSQLSTYPYTTVFFHHSKMWSPLGPHHSPVCKVLEQVCLTTQLLHPPLDTVTPTPPHLSQMCLRHLSLSFFLPLMHSLLIFYFHAGTIFGATCQLSYLKKWKMILLSTSCISSVLRDNNRLPSLKLCESERFLGDLFACLVVVQLQLQ